MRSQIKFTYMFRIQLHFYQFNITQMRKTSQTQPQPQPPSYKPTSSNYIASGIPVNSMNSQSQYMMMRTLETSADEIVQQQKNIYKLSKTDALDKLAKQDYQPAKYSKAVQYRNERSYMKKIDNQYRELDLFCDTDELRYFGLGTYFYIEFFRRAMWLFFALTILNAYSIFVNFKGIGLSNYSVSFSSYLIKTTLGNYSGQILSNYDVYAVAFAPALSYFAMLLFYWIWKVHFLRSISTQEEDNKDVKPQKFCLQVIGLPEEYVRQDEIIKFFTSFGPVYEVSLARNYDNKLSYFEDMDNLNQEIKEQELEQALDGDQSNRKSINQKKQKLQQLTDKLKQISIKPYTVSAFVHFQFQKSKVECLEYFNEHYLFSNCCHSCVRTLCCCCIKSPDNKVTFNGKTLLIARQYPPPPDDINWISFQIGFCNKFFRVIISFLIILIFLSISCTIIGLCSIYIETHSSNCDSVDTTIYTSTTITLASTDIIRCYCNAKLVDSFTDSTIQTACGDYLKDIYIQQAIQYAVIITSAVTNILFGLISDRLVNFIRPSSYSATLKYKTAILTLFFTLNSILIPVLIYADIFGFTPSSYVSFLTIISSGIRNFLKVDNLSFYPNFTAIWYRNVSPVFTNYILFNTIAVWGSFIFFKLCCSSKDSLKDQQHRILQKTMNNKITDFKVQIQKEAASLYLIIIMASIFWSGIPVLVPLAFVNIMSRYITSRSLLQNHSMRIAGLGQEFSSFTLVLLPTILILFPALGQWMLVANSKIYPLGIPIDFKLGFLMGHMAELDLQLYLPFYLGISALVIAQTVIYYLVIRFCSSLCSLCYQKKEIQYHQRPFAEYTKSLNILCSYNVRNNDSMRNAILNLQKYLIQYDSK